MTEPSSSIKTSTILIASTGVVVSGLIAYAAYFDYKRRSDPAFRKALKRDSKKEARAAKEEADAQGARQERAIQEIVDQSREEDFPTGIEEREAYFMQEVSRGETLLQSSDQLEAASCFYKALKVYPNPPDLIGIYEKTVSKPVIDLLAKIIARDPDLSSRVGSTGSGNVFDVDD